MRSSNSTVFLLSKSLSGTKQNISIKTLSGKKTAILLLMKSFHILQRVKIKLHVAKEAAQVYNTISHLVPNIFCQLLRQFGSYLPFCNAKGS